jgi:putative RecB family exonuclease
VAAWRHSEASLRRHLARMEQTADDLALATDTLAAGGDAEVLFPPRPSARCAYCDFRRHCPDGQAAAPEAQPWALLVP